MSSERQKILEMLENGLITAGEASDLLEALSGDSGGASQETYAGAESEFVHEGVVVNPSGTEIPPDMDRIRGFWQYPFYVAVAVLTLSGLGLYGIYGASQGQATFWLFCVWSIFVFAALATMLAFWSRTARWLHVRVEEKKGSKIAISLPVPIRLASWGIGIARNFVDDETSEYLTMADGFIDTMLHEMGDTPLIVDVDDDDGDRVKVYIG